MKQLENYDYAEAIFLEHGLDVAGWQLKTNNRYTSLGLCKESKKIIELSKAFLDKADKVDVKHVMLHEIAHAIVGNKHSHDRKWQSVALQIGIDSAITCYDKPIISREDTAKYVGNCSTCQNKTYMYRRSNKRSACGICCIKYNGGRFSEKYLIEWSEKR